MARSQRTITLEIPQELVKLTPEQKARLRQTFRTTIANELSTITEATFDFLIENFKPVIPGPLKKGTAGARKATAKKGTKKK